MLPIANRLAMKYVAKLSTQFLSKENKLIELSNQYLIGAKETEKGIKELGVDVSQLLKKGLNYEQIRKKLINAKNAVLSFDFLFTSGALGSIGFINNYLTKKKTGRDGFSAEFNMADKGIIDRRAERYKKSEKYRKASFVTLLVLLAVVPLALKKGLSAQNVSKFVRDWAPAFDYTDGIMMKRLPLFLATLTAYYGVSVASRNRTELKDNLIRAGVAQSVFYGGDIVIGSFLGLLSDKFLHTNIIDRNPQSLLVNKIIPPAKPLKALQGKSKALGAAQFWLNIISLSLIMGFGTPHLINKMIKKDVKKDNVPNINPLIFNPLMLKDFDRFFQGKKKTEQTV